VEFHVLGPLEVTHGGRSLAVGGARTRAVLAMLLLNANRVVSADLLADELWPGLSQQRAAANLQVRLSELRRALRTAGEADRLATRSPGYLLRVTAEELDVLRFEQLAAAGRDALTAGDAAGAVGLLDRALALWQGPALADLDDLQFARAEATRLEEARLGVVESRVDAQLASGRHHGMLAELETLTVSYPLRERFWHQRLLALYRSGRQADALRAYRQLRTTLTGQLGIEPRAELRELHSRILRQDPELDYRPVRQAARESGEKPETRYADSDGISIAYQVLGEGQLDIIAVPGLVSHLDLWWEDPTASRFFRRLASLGRLIMFDKRDTGLSDSAPGDLSLERRMEDVRAVMRACDSSRAVLFGYSEGGPMSILFAATYPESVTSLILAAAAARWSPAPDYPCGRGSAEMFEAFERLASGGWGQGGSIEWYAPSRAGSARARRELARWERMAASPSAMLRMIAVCRSVDVRGALPAVGVPALIIQREDDRITPPCHGRYLAAHIAHARYFQQPGEHLLWLGDTDAMFAEIEQFLTGPPGRSESDRVLTTILRQELPGALNAAIIGQHVRAQRGHLISTPGRELLATFDGPGRAIRCAAAIRDAAATAGIQARAGIHAGEADMHGDQITGTAVDITGRIAALARPAEILVSRTVKDLVVGSGIAFADRGSHRLTGIADAWPLFAVTGL
jgi:DNA-binding SARP family transcriptional activator/pimeloyl-ACP methyl ester carboxylesterase